MSAARRNPKEAGGKLPARGPRTWGQAEHAGTSQPNQQAIAQVLTPIFDPTFSASGFGFRPGRKAHDAVRQIQSYAQAGYTWVVDLDLEKFFDRVNHDVLMARVARKVTDKRVLRLIRRYLQSGIMLNGVRVRSEEGTP